MRILWPLAFLFSFICGSTAFGQTSLEAQLARGPDGHPRVTLTNTYTADARAYIVECHYIGPNSKDSVYKVSHEGIGGPPYTVWAGKSEAIGCPLSTTQVDVIAVAYDDGKTEGDSQSLTALAQQRQIEAEDVFEDIQILQTALAKVGTGSSVQGSPASLEVAQLATEFLTVPTSTRTLPLEPSPKITCAPQ